ncbi:hypothetical protein GOP47_0011723 [Adiantum capillus-veneris]|uniref:F-box domain-containing protein n=1 Tax=Adiantum capillus-veneris TaxID=13818 RepID=A0A9D4UTA7_ADICA|nr:hypothetical protein GOP47_0011723 [Adiantum capillus-veneris]
MASGRKLKPCRGTAKMQSVNDKAKRKGKKKRETEEAAERGSWPQLPPDLAARILGLLPVHHAINAMAVCKQWRSFLLQRSMSLAGAKGETLCPIFVSTSWCGYHSASGRWLRYPNLYFLPFPIARVHSSHRGLLLVESSANDLHLCNFATQRHWPLPPLPEALRGGLTFGVGSVYWCHCHLRVGDRDGHTIFSVTGLMRANNSAAGWHRLVRFESNEWQVGVSGVLLRNVFVEGVDRMVVLPNGCMYVMAPGKEGWHYLVRHEPSARGWELVSKIQAASAQIVAFGETLMAVALDHRWRSRQIHLYRLANINADGEGEEAQTLVLEESSGAQLAEFVEDCGTHFWYTTSSSYRIYVGVRLSHLEGLAKPGPSSLVEYEGLSHAWRHVPLPPDLKDDHPEDQKYPRRSLTSTSIITGDAYHELGLATHPTNISFA